MKIISALSFEKEFLAFGAGLLIKSSMDWKNILVIVFAAIIAGIFAPIVTTKILNWLKKIGIIKEKNKQ